MDERQIPRAPKIPFFFIFGTIGGWLLALALSPSGLAAICALFLITAAPLSLLISSLSLAAQIERTRFHLVAMWSGFGYVIALGLYILTIVVIGKLS